VKYKGTLATEEILKIVLGIITAAVVIYVVTTQAGDANLL